MELLIYTLACIALGVCLTQMVMKRQQIAMKRKHSEHCAELNAEIDACEDILSKLGYSEEEVTI